MRGQAVISILLLNFPRSPSRPPPSVTLPPRLFSLSYPHESFSPPQKASNCPPNSVFPCSVGDPLEDFISLLKSSKSSFSAFPEVASLHSRAIKVGLAENVQVGTRVLNLYARCNSLCHARKLFDELPHCGGLACTILISAYFRSGQDELGMGLFFRMLLDGMLPNCFTLASVVKCCAKNDDPRVGKGIHGWITRNGIEMDVVLQNAIIDFYAKCGAFRCARNVFEMMDERDAVSWNVMIGAHLLCGDTNGAMELFRASPSRDVSSWNTFISGQMQIGHDRTAIELLHLMVKIGPRFNQYTLSIGLVLAAKLALLELGKQMHNKLLRLGFENDAFIMNSLINMYCNCGKMETSSAVFNELKPSCMGSLAKTISLSSLITGFVKNGRSEQALELFCRMLHQGAMPDPFTLTSVAAACANAGVLELGKQIHACIQKLGHGLDMFLASAVIDMYAKCGSLDDAWKTFNVMESKNVVLWTSMLGSYARHGEGRKAIRVFEMMMEKNIKPNEISFVGVLSACSHEGLVEEGYKYFKLMQNDHGILPTIEHLTSMVDLLCRSGLLDEAKKFINEYNLGEYSVVWKALLSASRVHSDIQTARWASEQLVQIEPHEPGSYVLLSNTCSTKREWVEASKLWSAMKNKGIKKQPGSSWI